MHLAQWVDEFCRSAFLWAPLSTPVVLYPPTGTSCHHGEADISLQPHPSGPVYPRSSSGSPLCRCNMLVYSVFALPRSHPPRELRHHHHLQKLHIKEKHQHHHHNNTCERKGEMVNIIF